MEIYCVLFPRAFYMLNEIRSRQSLQFDSLLSGIDDQQAVFYSFTAASKRKQSDQMNDQTVIRSH